MATRVLAAPAWNASMLRVRAFCERLPWSSTAGTPEALSCGGDFDDPKAEGDFGNLAQGLLDWAAALRVHGTVGAMADFALSCLCDMKMTKPRMTKRKAALVMTVPKPRPPFDVGCDIKSPRDAPRGRVRM